MCLNILKTCPRKAQKDTVSKKTFQTARHTGRKVMLLGFSQKTVGAQYLSWHQKKESETSQLYLFLSFFLRRMNHQVALESINK